MNRENLRTCSGTYPEISNIGTMKEVKFEKGYFHQWSVDTILTPKQEVGLVSCAIVELEDGKIVTPPATGIKFTDITGVENEK